MGNLWMLHGELVSVYGESVPGVLLSVPWWLVTACGKLVSVPWRICECSMLNQRVLHVELASAPWWIGCVGCVGIFKMHIFNEDLFTLLKFDWNCSQGPKWQHIGPGDG